MQQRISWITESLLIFNADDEFDSNEQPRARTTNVVTITRRDNDCAPEGYVKASWLESDICNFPAALCLLGRLHLLLR